jgi:hypothetical protein
MVEHAALVDVRAAATEVRREGFYEREMVEL